MRRVNIHERDTEGTSDAGVPGIVPAIYLLQRVLYVAASSAWGQRVSRKMLEYYIWGIDGTTRCSDQVWW